MSAYWEMMKRGATLTYLPEAADAIYAADAEANAAGADKAVAEEEEDMPLY